MTSEEQRLDEARIAAENLARKEKLEAERWKAQFDQKERELKQQEDLKRREFRHQKKLGKRNVRGTIAVALIGLIGTAVGVFKMVGDKADPSVTNFFGTVYQGAVSSYKLVSPNYSVAQAFPKSVSANSASPVHQTSVREHSPEALPIVPTPSSVQPVTPVADNTCSGLNVKDWTITPGTVTPSTQGGASYYTARVNLTNNTEDPMTISRGGGELTDDQNHSFALAGSSISSAYPPTTVDSHVPLPATFVFRGQGNNGKKVWFTVGVQTSSPAGKPGGSHVIGCNALTVQQVVN